LSAAAASPGLAVANTVTSLDTVVIAGVTPTRRKPSPQVAEEAARDASVVTTASPAAGNAGYVHFFVITGPDGEPETEVGIELPGERIAWSFPGLGVVVHPFTKAGVIFAGGKSYAVEHVYGIRPFADEPAMRVLQQDLARRIAPWEQTPFCDEERANDECLTCLGFVLRVLFPGPTAGPPALPRDFRGVRSDIYTTEDLLLYLARIPVDGPVAARLKRIESLSVPEAMREDLQRIAGDIDAVRAAAAKEAAAAAVAEKARPKPPTIVDLLKRLLPRRRS
jgi:hypothetical protein